MMMMVGNTPAPMHASASSVHLLRHKTTTPIRSALYAKTGPRRVLKGRPKSLVGGAFVLHFSPIDCASIGSGEQERRRVVRNF